MIDRLQRGFMLIVICCVFSVSPTFAEGRSGLLDGMTFIGYNGEMGRELDPDEYEEIIFQDGLFRSVSCEPYHFGSGEYSAQVVNNSIHFEAVTESPTHGKITWQGVVDGDTAEVTFVWTKERWYWDTRREYWFRGTLKK